jgi:glycosyltransferase involved in cell wall biosynthesis
MSTDNTQTLQPRQIGLPVVSIICNTYNHEAYIRDALDGFLMQQCTFPFEILIHDDASTDETPNIIREYAAKFPEIIKPIYQSENQWSKGDFRVFRLQRERAQGRYIALCEGDDYWIDNKKLQKQVNFLESHPDFVMCFHRCKIENNTNDWWKDRIYNHLKEKEYTGQEILSIWTIPTASVVYRYTLSPILAAMHVPKEILYIDTFSYLTFAEHGRIYCLGDTMAVYRIHHKSVTNRNDPQRGTKYSHHLMAMSQIFNGKYKQTVEVIMADRYITGALIAMKNRNIQRVLICLFKSVQLDPLSIPKRCMQFIQNQMYFYLGKKRS